MAVGDKYVATLSAHYGSDIDNPINNVFAYEGATGASTASDLADTIGTTMVSLITPFTSDVVTYDTVVVINLDDLTDFATRIVGVAGTITGNALPKFVSWSFEYFRATRDVANGRKAFAGVSEALQANGTPADPSVNALLDDLAEYLSTDIAGVTVGVTYTPRIWRRAGVYASGTFPDTFYPISAVGFKRISTQNTRKK